MTARNRQAPASPGPPPEDRSAPVRRIAGWLRGPEARALDDAGLLSSLGGRLREAGLCLDRLMFHIVTLHPETFSRILAWAPDEPVEVYGRDHPATVAAGFPGSPFRHVAASRQKWTTRAVEPHYIGRAAGPLLQSRGIGELIVAPFGGLGGRIVIVTFCAARPNVFGAADQRMIDGIVKSEMNGS